MPQPGKLGRLPFDPERPRLVLEKYLDPRSTLSRSGLPPVPWDADVDRSSQVSSFPMYKNDQVGCCTVAGLGHLFGAVSVYGTGTEVLFSDDEIIRTYSRVTGYVPGDESTDNGALCSDVLADAVTNGMTDTAGKLHKVVGHAQLGNPADEELLAQCLDVFGSLYLGFNVQQHMMDQFSAGQQGGPTSENFWTWQPGDQVVGGHCVVTQRRYPCGSRQGVLEQVTWGARQRANFGWQAHAVEEAHVVVTSEWLRANGTSVEGMDLYTLISDMDYVKSLSFRDLRLPDYMGK